MSRRTGADCLTVQPFTTTCRLAPSALEFLVVTALALRHLDADPSLLAAVVGADWAGAAGIDTLDVGPLAQPLRPDRPLPLGVLVLLGPAASSDLPRLAEQLKGFGHEVPTVVLGLADPGPASVVGVVPSGMTPVHEIRVRAQPGVDPRRVDDLLVRDRLLLLSPLPSGTRVLATANVALRDYPVLTFDPAAGLGALTVGAEPSAWRDAGFLRLLRHGFWAADPVAEDSAVRVGMLAYGAIGHEHALAIQEVPGLQLVGVADPDVSRLDVASELSGGVATFTDPGDLLDDDDVDLVIISTPPDGHAKWAQRALTAGKHVVLEKPMALTASDCTDLMGAAAAADLMLVVYQNRRFDPDYVTLRSLVRDGRIGELFHLEAFIGGYQHPCNYWHSDAGVSGGAIFDWGSHLIDQILDLMPGRIRAVTANNHKRRWFDVTNADHARVTLHYDDGREAEFVYSDLAASLKPKWWALGTEGAAVGRWRSERVVARTAIGTLDEDRLAPADSPADIELHGPDGSVTQVPVPPPRAQPFHRELADHLLRGLPMSVRPEQSRRVVAVMEAAERSAAHDSSPVLLD
jgi:predicted dehydrogenase